MRKQYFFRPSDRGLLSWDVDRLVALTRSLPRRRVALADIRELDQPWFGETEPRSWRELAEHLKLVNAAELTYPIILAADGAVMDGMHRVVKAYSSGQQDIEAVQFLEDPEPDHVGLGPGDLTY